MKIEKLVPDTSVIIEGILTQKIESKEIKPETVLIHEATVSELEHQANLNKETGFLGLEELTKLKSLSSKLGFAVEFSGKKPTPAEIKYAKMGDVDSLIRELAYDNGATLLTADLVQSKVADAKGISVIFIEIEKIERKLKLESFFDKDTMSVHLRESNEPYAKKGMPGRWDFIKIKEKALEKEEIIQISREIIEEAKAKPDCFIEIDRPGSTIVQLGVYRIVITKPPFSDGWEITAVRPVKKLSLKDYKLSEKLNKRVAEQAEGILIAGAPGNGKSTFAQALAEYYSSQKKIVKTVEAPRDLQLPDSITQLAISHGSSQEIHDILLLSRPDYTIFDEMRNTEDFKLFADMRLSGVGMIGIVHATNPIDAIQRFIGRIELGVIPQVIDTVLFIQDGTVAHVFEVKMEVKVPSGMTEADLARPVVTVTDFETGKLEFEIYSYGEETVVVPVSEFKDARMDMAARGIEKEFESYTDRAKVEVVSANKVIVYVPEHDIAAVIGKKGSNIEKLEQRIGMSIDVQPLTAEDEEGKGRELKYEYKISKKAINFMLSQKEADKDVDVYVNDEYLLTAKSSRKAVIKLRKDSKIGKALANAINYGEKIKLVSS